MMSCYSYRSQLSLCKGRKQWKQLKLQEEIKGEWSKKTTAANLLLLSQLLMTQTIEIKN
jgi:hypothetical protein